jgi:hypothetical protein
VKQAIQQAVEAIGKKRGADDDESGSRTLAKYFEWLAEEYPSECARLLGLVLQPQEENVDRDTQKGVYRTAEEFRAALARDGVPVDEITAIGENQLHDTVSTVSRVSGDEYGAGLSRPPAGLEHRGFHEISG